MIKPSYFSTHSSPIRASTHPLKAEHMIPTPSLSQHQIQKPISPPLLSSSAHSQHTVMRSLPEEPRGGPALRGCMCAHGSVLSRECVMGGPRVNHPHSDSPLHLPPSRDRRHQMRWVVVVEGSVDVMEWIGGASGWMRARAWTATSREWVCATERWCSM